MTVSVLRFPCKVFLLITLLWSAAPDLSAQPVTQPFTFSLVPHTMPQLAHAITALGDVDNDGDLDVFLSGIDEDRFVAAVYRNVGEEARDGTRTFVFEEGNADVAALGYGAASWGDYDGDGDLDLVVSGSRNIDPPYDPETILYRNDGGELVATNVSLEGYHSGAAEWGDFDNDGDLDLLLGGEGETGASETRLYRNDGGAFDEEETNLPGLAYGAAAWGDADGDGDLDLVMTGMARDGIYADVYRNDDRAFTRINTELEPAVFADVSWGDFDADGDLDVIQGGGRFSPNILEGFTRVYDNAGGRFDSLSFELPGAVSGAVTWGDYDSDGDLDLLVMGAAEHVFGRRLARIYANMESGFADKIHLVGVVFGSATWGDLDGDGDLDLIVSGRPTVGDPFINVYENRRQVIEPVIEPAGLQALVSPGTVTLSWDAAAGEPLSYNVRIGSTPGNGDVVSPMADIGTGRRRLAAAGNAQGNHSWTICDLEPGTYYWSVQTIDAAYRASEFAPEQQFAISQSTSSETVENDLPVETLLYPPSPNPSAGPVTLRYDLAKRNDVEIRIYDLLGRTVAVPVEGEQGPGRHSMIWNGRDAAGSMVASGVYLCDMRAASYRKTVTVVISR